MFNSQSRNYVFSTEGWDLRSAKFIDSRDSIISIQTTLIQSKKRTNLVYLLHCLKLITRYTLDNELQKAIVDNEVHNTYNIEIYFFDLLTVSMILTFRKAKLRIKIWIRWTRLSMILNTDFIKTQHQRT